jgi:putative transposase
MIRSFCYPLRPTRSQCAILECWLDQCCELYNAALEQRREAWRKQRTQISCYMQQKGLTELREADSAWGEAPVWVQRSALARVDRAFQAFFRRVKCGEKPGYPRFRSRSQYTSFDLGSNPVSVVGARVRLPKLGPVSFHKYRELRGVVKHVRVHQGPRGWCVSFVCDLGSSPMKVPVRAAVGVDVGLEVFATLSNGERVENPRVCQRSADAVARRHRSLARKRRGSKSRAKARRLVGRAYACIRNQRLDFVRKLASVLFARFDVVAYEDLAISRMMHGTFAKSIKDAAWGLFYSALTRKAESAGKYAIAVDPCCTSQICPSCGLIAKKPLGERRHTCSCGFVAHRDHAAAQVILGRGLRLGQLTEVQSVGLGPVWTEPATADGDRVARAGLV